MEMTKAKVFIIDRNKLVLHWLKRLVEAEPDLVVSGEASEVSEAIAQMKAAHPDVLVVDVDPFGWEEAVDRLRRAHPHIPLLALSIKETAPRGNGSSRFLSKAIAARRVIPVIRLLLKKPSRNGFKKLEAK